MGQYEPINRQYTGAQVHVHTRINYYAEASSSRAGSSVPFSLTGIT